MPKIFVLDTNVLLHDPNSLYNFQDNLVVIPITVIEELDNFKKDMNEKGRNARHVSRKLDSLRETGSLTEGVPLENSGELRVDIFDPENFKTLPPEFRVDHPDNRILALSKALQHQEKRPVVLVTKDTNLRIKAEAVKLTAQSYNTDTVEIQDLYPGTIELTLSGNQVDHFFEEHFLSIDQELFPNQMVTLIDESNPSHTAIGRYDNDTKQIVQLIKPPRDGIWGLHPRNREQQFALDLLLNDDIQLVTLVGKAGTGKTLLAIAAGLLKTADEGVYNRLLVSRPIYPLGKDLGFLPGDIEEKLAPWMQPIFDNVELLLGNVDEEGKKKRGYRELVDMGFMQIEPLTYIRGRSIPHQFMIVDEAQNLTPHEIKTIITRAGEGTKIVLTGDAYQIDNPYVDSASNGLSYVVERFKESGIAGHITLRKGERSCLAELAANLL